MFNSGSIINIEKYDLPHLDRNKYSIRFAPFGNDINFDLMGILNQKYKIINKESGELLYSGIINQSKLPRVYSESADNIELVVGNDNWKIDIQKIKNENNIDDFCEINSFNLYPKFHETDEDFNFIDLDFVKLIMNNK